MKIEEIKEILVSSTQNIVGKEAAEYFANECIETHIRKSPRSNPLKSTITDAIATIENKDKEITYAVDLPSYFAIDFNKQGPLVYLKKIHDELEDRSMKSGIAMVAFKNSKSMHTLHTWVQGLAKRGLMAVAVCNGGPNAVVPFNGNKGVFGTNPIAYGFPGKDNEIYCIDMATSEAPYFEIMDAHAESKPLREGVAVDFDGKPTIDTAKALDFSVSKTDPYSNLLPMGGGYKGYYIVFLMELLTSALIGMPASPDMTADFVPEEHGAILIAFNPKAMGSADSFVQTVEKLKGAVESQNTEDREVRFPGENNNEKYSKHSSDEIDLDSKTIEKLDALRSLIKENK